MLGNRKMQIGQPYPLIALTNCRILLGSAVNALPIPGGPLKRKITSFYSIWLVRQPQQFVIFRCTFAVGEVVEVCLFIHCFWRNDGRPNPLLNFAKNNVR
jgi:hypothetical protein